MTTAPDDTASARPAHAEATKPAARRALRRTVPWVLIAALAGGGYFAWQKYSAAQREPKIRYESAAIGTGPISAKVTASGTVSALVTVLVGSQVSGRIDSIRVDYNSPV